MTAPATISRGQPEAEDQIPFFTSVLEVVLRWIRERTQLAEEAHPVDLPPVLTLDNPTGLEAMNPDALHADSPAGGGDPFELAAVGAAPSEASDDLVALGDQVLNRVV